MIYNAIDKSSTVCNSCFVNFESAFYKFESIPHDPYRHLKTLGKHRSVNPKVQTYFDKIGKIYLVRDR